VRGGGPQPGEGDGDEAAGGVFGGQAAGGGEGVQAVAREFVRGDVVPDVPGRRGLGDQAGDEGVQLLLGLVDVLAAVQQFGDAGAVRSPGAVVQRVRLERGAQSLPGGACGVGGLGELGEVLADLALVPGDQDRLDVGEVLVQRGPADAGPLGDLGHRHRGQPVLGYQRGHGVQDRVLDRRAVRSDRLGPQSRHPCSIQDVPLDTI
jgi:hypothetical protein